LPFADEFECEILRPRPVGVNATVKFNEAALFHKASRTLLVTDAVVHVGESIPAVLERPLLLESGDDDNFVIWALKVRPRPRPSLPISLMTDLIHLRILGWIDPGIQTLS
jgi:hypothetical protein